MIIITENYLSATASRLFISGVTSLALPSKPFMWSSSRSFLQDSIKFSIVLDCCLFSSSFLLILEIVTDLVSAKSVSSCWRCWRKLAVVSSIIRLNWSSIFWQAWLWIAYKSDRKLKNVDTLTVCTYFPICITYWIKNVNRWHFEIHVFFFSKKYMYFTMPYY